MVSINADLAQARRWRDSGGESRHQTSVSHPGEEDTVGESGVYQAGISTVSMCTTPLPTCTSPHTTFDAPVKVTSCRPERWPQSHLGHGGSGGTGLRGHGGASSSDRGVGGCSRNSGSGSCNGGVGGCSGHGGLNRSTCRGGFNSCAGHRRVGGLARRAGSEQYYGTHGGSDEWDANEAMGEHI